MKNNAYCENLKDLKFQPGDRVFAISPKGEIYEVGIRWVNARLFKEDTGNAFYLMSYEGSTMNQFSNDVFDCSFTQNELYKTKKSAQKAARFIPIEFSDDDWYKAIGLKKGVDRIDYAEDCDLQPCCANISAIRDSLNFCRQNKGLIFREKKRLQRILDNSGHNLPTDCKKLLDILNAIGVEWKA